MSRTGRGQQYGLSTLRAKTLAVIAVLVVTPVLFVWLTSPFETALGGDLRSEMTHAAHQAADLVRIEAPDSEFTKIARRFGLWIRVLGPGGRVVSANENQPTLRERLLFAPDPVPTVASWDAEQPPFHERRESELARAEGAAGSCGYANDGQLLVCTRASVVRPTGREPVLIHVVAANAHATSGLYGERWQVLKVMSVVLVVALVLGGWLASRITRPLQRLRDQVRERTKPPVSTRPVDRGDDADFAELADAFNELLGAVDEHRRANERFMADMAHEIKNPVAAIRAAAESLARGEDVSAQRAARLARILDDSSRRLDGVVSNFLELARAESGLPQVQNDEFKFDELVHNVAATYRADERHARLNLVVQCDEVWASGSAEHIERALRNLVENALSFARTTVTVTARRRTDLIEVSVQDDGSGIAHADLDRVFDRFFTRRDDGSGTGLGLAMTRAIIEAHGGEITVESTVGIGTTFTFTLQRLRGS